MRGVHIHRRYIDNASLIGDDKCREIIRELGPPPTLGEWISTVPGPWKYGDYICDLVYDSGSPFVCDHRDGCGCGTSPMWVNTFRNSMTEVYIDSRAVERLHIDIN
jgi:hypothetical protein